MKEAINYIIEKNYVHKNLTPSVDKTFPIEFTFILNGRFLKQVDGCTMGRPLSFTFSNICR